MTKLLFVFLLMISISTFANDKKSSDAFSICRDATGIEMKLSKIKILGKATLRGCPRELAVHEFDFITKILTLSSVRSGTSGGQYSENYDDIKGFISCSYANPDLPIGCDLLESSFELDDLGESIILHLEDTRRDWQARNNK